MKDLLVFLLQLELARKNLDGYLDAGKGVLYLMGQTRRHLPGDHQLFRTLQCFFGLFPVGDILVEGKDVFLILEFEKPRTDLDGEDGAVASSMGDLCVDPLSIQYAPNTLRALRGSLRSVEILYLELQQLIDRIAVHVSGGLIGRDDPADIFSLGLQDEDGVTGAFKEHSIALLILLDLVDRGSEGERHVVEGVAQLAELIPQPFGLVLQVTGFQSPGRVEKGLHRAGELPCEEDRNAQAESWACDDEQGQQVLGCGDTLHGCFGPAGELLR